MRGNNYTDCTKEFRETKRYSLDLMVKDAFRYIFSQPQAIRLERQEYKRQLEQERIRQEERRRKEAIHDEEFAQTQALIKLSKQYEISCNINRLLDYLEHENINEDYIQWGRNKADWLDPVRKQADPILNEEDKDLLIESKEKQKRYYW